MPEELLRDADEEGGGGRERLVRGGGPWLDNPAERPRLIMAVMDLRAAVGPPPGGPLEP